MAVQLINGMVVEVIPYALMGPQIGINIYHFRIGVTAGAITDQDVLTAISAGAGAFDLPTLLRLCMNQQATYAGMTGQIIHSIRYPLVSDITGNGPGTSGPTPVPNQVAGLIFKRGQFANRRNMGRTYVPFPSTSDVVPGTVGSDAPTNAYVFGLTNLATAMFPAAPPTIMGAGGGTAVIVPIIYNPAPKPPLPLDITIDVKSFLVRRKWATQKRRGDYGRPNTLPF